MSIDSPLNSLHRALGHAVHVGFPEIEYEDRDWASKDKDARITRKRKHSEYDLTVVAMFPQVWGSTALGFGGVGGQAITAAYTIVIESGHGYGYCVYFSGRFAYRIEKPNSAFHGEMLEKRMNEVNGAKRKYEQD